MFICSLFQVPPEEAEKRKLRRERNKQAAAKCRQRRVDQTNTLINVSTLKISPFVSAIIILFSVGM